MVASAVGGLALGGEGGAGERLDSRTPARLEGQGKVLVVHGGRLRSVRSDGLAGSEPLLAYPASEAFRDPATGRFVAPAPGEAPAAGPERLRSALSTSAEGLVEESVAASPGGVRVDLRGRFRSATVAERGVDGSVAVVCGKPAAAGVEAADPSASPLVSTPRGAR